jgi:hypothetical protein
VAVLDGSTQVVSDKQRPEFRRKQIELLVAEGISRAQRRKSFTRLSNKLLFGTGLRAKFYFADAEQPNQFSCGTGAERFGR